jgi:general secretion pathway protein L
MKLLDRIKGAFWNWLDTVAEVAVTLAARIVKPRIIRLLEEEPDQFAILSSDKKDAAALRAVKLRVNNGVIVDQVSPQVEAALRGSQIELTLRSERFVFKPLDLPARAAEFLDGVVRAQIDRLTPWTADLAAFGFSAPVDAGAGRLGVTVAATAKAMLAPMVQAFAAHGAHAITVAAHAPEAGLPAIMVMNESAGGMLSTQKARGILLTVLVSCGLATAATLTAAAILGGGLESRQAELARRIMEERGAALAARNAPGDPMATAELALATRKNQTPSAVIAVEVLSRILPDDTYVTELRMEADKLRVTGITDDAPRLIRLMEQTPQFTQAVFFAPITRSSSDARDRFDIEAHIEPVFSPLP